MECFVCWGSRPKQEPSDLQLVQDMLLLGSHQHPLTGWLMMFQQRIGVAAASPAKIHPNEMLLPADQHTFSAALTLNSIDQV